VNQVNVTGVINGFDGALYKSIARWDNFILYEVFNGSARFEAWADEVDTIDKVEKAVVVLDELIMRFILSVEWSLGQKLSYTIDNIEKPSFASENASIEVMDKIYVKDSCESELACRNIPNNIPQVPLEAKRWILIWVEASQFDDYVEEQLRRHYLIIEELWQELHHIFDESQRAEKKKIKLIRDFVSHAHLDNDDIISLVKYDLPSAYDEEKNRVQFKRTTEHRNFINNYEVKSRQIARALVEAKIKQLGVVSGT